MKFELIDVSNEEGIQKFYYYYSFAYPYITKTMKLFNEPAILGAKRLHDNVLRGQLKFWHWDTNAFCAHEEFRYDEKPDTIRVIIGLGENANEWAHCFLRTLDEYAIQNKFKRLEVYSRLGWEKLKARRQDDAGYDVARIVYKKTLK